MSENQISKEEKALLLQAVKAAYKAIDDKFGYDCMILDVSKVSIMADYFMIATANSPNQLKAITDEVEMQLHKLGVRLRHSEGVQTARWILLDFNGLVVHLFCKEDREYYRLERIWGDATEIKPEEL